MATATKKKLELRNPMAGMTKPTITLVIGIHLIIAGILVVQLATPWGWAGIILGAAIAAAGAIQLCWTGEREVGN